MNIIPIFSNFVSTDNLNFNNDELTKYAYTVMGTDPGVFISNEGGWQSNDVSLADEMKLFVTTIEEQANTLHKEIGLNDKFKQIISNVWININKPLNYNKAHMHPHSCLSGVYYVKAEERSGCIEMLNPVTSFYHTIPTDAIGKPGSFNSQLCTLPPSPGLLIMFPSWLMHYTQPNLSKEDRISIAFNTILVEADE